MYDSHIMDEIKNSDDFFKSPFGESELWDFNACVGPNGGPYDYRDYAIGYFHAGHNIVEDILKNGTNEVDIMIYPLMYSYRHALELSLKNILVNAGIRVHSHNLDTLWKNVESIIISIVSSNEKNCVTSLKEVVDSFLVVDPIGETFRFPEGKDKNLFLQDMRIINILPVYEKMKKIEEIMGYLDYVQRRKLVEET